jgi:hypothetical protein
MQVEAWVDRTTPPSARLYGEHHEETTTIGKDFTVLDAGGSGRLAAWVLDLVGQPGSSAFQSYMEGNPRIYIDGSRSPSIIGTGTEDTFNGAWYYQNGAFSLLTHGAGPLGKPSSLESSQSQYRVFGGDGPLWADAIHFGMQHGAGDENVTTAANTTFSYRTPGTLVRTDALAPADRASDAAHHLTGPVRPTTLSAYFEGERDGNITVPLVPLLGSRLAPPPALSPDGVTAPGIGFDGPISFDLAVTAGCDIRLRRLLDAGTASTMAVAVAGQTVGTWAITEANGWKRWREDDFEIPAALAGGHGQVRVTLSPTAGRATLYGLTAYADC